jgi:DNA-directed RNA polymerase subunit alpha
MFSFPSSPKIIKKDKDTAQFEIRALYPGYGVTVGNALRRVLLSSLPGAAITLVKIKDVAHEFSTLPGVYEDVVSIMLNLKQLRFKLFSDEPEKILLSVKGEQEVKAKDMKIPSQIELINKDAHIATLTKKTAELDIEVLVEKGLGYEPAEKKKKEKLEVGEIAMDAIFTPVRKVNFVVENMRVGDRTDYDLLKVEIETDGTITPEQAISSASEILVKHFSPFVDEFKVREEPKEEKKIEKKVKPKKEKKEKKVVKKPIKKAKPRTKSK